MRPLLTIHVLTCARIQSKARWAHARTYAGAAMQELGQELRETRVSAASAQAAAQQLAAERNVLQVQLATANNEVTVLRTLTGTLQQHVQHGHDHGHCLGAVSSLASQGQGGFSAVERQHLQQELQAMRQALQVRCGWRKNVQDEDAAAGTQVWRWRSCEHGAAVYNLTMLIPATVLQDSKATEAQLRHELQEARQQARDLQAQLATARITSQQQQQPPPTPSGTSQGSVLALPGREGAQNQQGQPQQLLLMGPSQQAPSQLAGLQAPLFELAQAHAKATSLELQLQMMEKDYGAAKVGLGLSK